MAMSQVLGNLARDGDRPNASAANRLFDEIAGLQRIEEGPLEQRPFFFALTSLFSREFTFFHLRAATRGSALTAWRSFYTPVFQAQESMASTRADIGEER